MIRPADRRRRPCRASRQCFAAWWHGATWPFRCTVDHRVPLGLGDVEAHRVAEDAGVVDEDVEAAERRRPPAATSALGAGPRRDVVVVRDGGAAARRDDLVDDRARRVGVEVVDDDARALGGEQPRVAASDAATRAGDDRDLAVEHSHARRVSPDAASGATRSTRQCAGSATISPGIDEARIARAQRRAVRVDHRAPVRDDRRDRTGRASPVRARARRPRCARGCRPARRRACAPRRGAAVGGRGGRRRCRRREPAPAPGASGAAGGAGARTNGSSIAAGAVVVGASAPRVRDATGVSTIDALQRPDAGDAARQRRREPRRRAAQARSARPAPAPRHSTSEAERRATPTSGDGERRRRRRRAPGASPSCSEVGVQRGREHRHGRR